VAVGKLIKKWVKIVNAEYGLSHRNKQSIDFFMMIKDVATFIFEDNYYIVCLVSKDMWGYKTLSVISYYILPEHRNYKNFMEIQKRIDTLAKINKVKYIYQGSHLNSKLDRVLRKMGYSDGFLKKEIK
jgi:hypothetical protein